MTLCDGVSTFLLAVFSSYGVEIVGPSGRKYFGSLVGVAFALGFVLISVLAMYFPDRQLLTSFLSGICAVNLIYLPFIPESPVWLLSTDRFDQVRKSISTIASTVNVDEVRMLFELLDFDCFTSGSGQQLYKTNVCYVRKITPKFCHQSSSNFT